MFGKEYIGPANMIQSKTESVTPASFSQDAAKTHTDPLVNHLLREVSLQQGKHVAIRYNASTLLWML